MAWRQRVGGVAVRQALGRPIDPWMWGQGRCEEVDFQPRGGRGRAVTWVALCTEGTVLHGAPAVTCNARDADSAGVLVTPPIVVSVHGADTLPRVCDPDLARPVLLFRRLPGPAVPFRSTPTGR